MPDKTIKITVFKFKFLNPSPKNINTITLKINITIVLSPVTKVLFALLTPTFANTVVSPENIAAKIANIIHIIITNIIMYKKRNN